MELKQGYKQTEVGLIPEEWEVKPLGEGLTLQRGFDLPSRLRREGIVPIVSSAGVSAMHCEARVCAPGIVTGRYGTIGQVFFIEQDFWPLNTTLYVRSFKGNDPRYLSYLLRTVDFESHSGKSGVPGINRNDIHELLIPLPPLPEQRAIAEALSDVDALLGALDRLIAKKRDLKQAAMQQLLTGQTRLPDFQGEWEVKRLGDVATFYKGKGLPKSAISDSGGKLCIHYGELFTRYPETIGEIFSRTDSSTGAFCSVANDVLMPTSDVTPRGLAKASCVRVDGVILGGDILVIRSNTDLIFGSFLSCLIRYEETQVLQLVTGSTVYHLYGSDMKNFTFSMPSIAEQIAIAEVLSEMDAELAGLEQRREKTRALKQGMMQELLTGRTRLVTPQGTSA